ncbi:Lrp/AsnC family transcriptional regulator [Neptunomonas antarctica]|jgi:Lrp/AsnC family leucine-responsive transcriptional regulator|uniref:Transcriptional regulator, AsnC family n=1 Tax=Neptunomonas antarctica TaxID=619304 RepID=A0A1N7IUB0_9GAMM|nr:Lrp/AsnC family transcriptional regulator [Neptunomonas antarctica]SIS40654.1 transcriptional regulator, AsnC family [Neptunomonas antarctica]
MIDNINRRILNALQKNARISYAELGKQVHLSAPAVTERIRKMEQEGVITGYSVSVNMDKLGLPVLAIVQCKVFRAKERQFKELLLSIPDILECYNTTGEQAFIIKLATGSMARLDEILDLFGDMSDTNTMMILSAPVHRALPDTFFD